jgi:hypothetical protein
VRQSARKIPDLCLRISSKLRAQRALFTLARNSVYFSDTNQTNQSLNFLFGRFLLRYTDPLTTSNRGDFAAFSVIGQQTIKVPLQL